MSGEAILNAENSGKPLGGRGSAPEPRRGSSQRSPDPLAGGEGCCPSQKPLPAFGLGPSPLKLRPYGAIEIRLLPARRRPQGLVVIGVCLSVSLCVRTVFVRKISQERVHGSPPNLVDGSRG